MTEEFEKNVNEDLLDENESYPVMPLRNTVLFPQQVIPIYIGRDKSLKLINELSSKTKHVVVVAQEDGSIEDPEPSDMYSYGTLAVVLKVFDMPDNSKSAIVQGIDRVKILDYKEKDPYYRAVVQRISNKSSKDSVELDALANNLRQVFSELIQIAPNLSEEHTGMLSNIQKPARLADRAVSLLTVSNPEKQDILEELDVKKRVEKAIRLDNNIVQIILDMPFPFNGRDYVVQYDINQLKDQWIFSYSSVKHPNEISNQNYVRLPNAAGIWILNTTNTNMTKVTYAWNGELLGNFPDFGLKEAWIKQGTEVLLWLNKALEES